MDPNFERLQFLTRRHFFKHSAAGLGAIALASRRARSFRR